MIRQVLSKEAVLCGYVTFIKGCTRFPFLPQVWPLCQHRERERENENVIYIQGRPLTSETRIVKR